MGKFYVVNELHEETVIVREGAGSAFSQVNSIPSGQQRLMRVNSKATHREILLVVEKLNLQATFSSDDFQGCAEVRVTGYSDSELVCKRTLKSSHDVSGMTTDANLSNIWQSVLRFVGLGRKQKSKQPAAASQPSQPAAISQPAVASQTGGSVPTRGSVPTSGSAPDGGSAKLVEASQPAAAPRTGGNIPTGGSGSDGSNAKLAEASQLTVAAPEGSSAPDSGSAKPEEESLTNGATQTDGAEHQATVPVI